MTLTASLCVCVQILAVGDGAFVSHCLLGGEVKAQIPCTPPSLNTLQLNTRSSEHRVRP